MDFYQLLETLESAIFEFASWFIFLPRTLLFVLFKPHLVNGVVLANLKLRPQDRFERLMSPSLFWILIGVLPALWLFVGFWGKSTQNANALDTQTSLAITAIILALGPIAFAAVMLFVSRTSFTRSGLQPLFFAQCYLFAPLYLSSFLLVQWLINGVIEALASSQTRVDRKSLQQNHLSGTSTPIGHPHGWLDNGVVVYLTFVILIWFLAAEFIIAYQHLNKESPQWVRIGRTCETVFLALVLWGLLTVLIVFYWSNMLSIVRSIEPQGALAQVLY